MTPYLSEARRSARQAPRASRHRFGRGQWLALALAAIGSSVLAAQLTILDGVVVKFGDGARLVVRDKLQTGKGVRLTDAQDDGKGSLQQGKWRGVRVEKSAASHGLMLDQLTIAYAAEAGLTLRGFSPALQSPQFWHNRVGLSLLDGANPNISDAGFFANGIGLQALAGSLPNVSNSAFVGNRDYAVSNVGTQPLLQARGNWWGHASGPKDSVANPDGQGDAVSAGVNYASWLGSAPLLAPSIRSAFPASYYAQRKLRFDISCINAVAYRIAENDQFQGVDFQPLPNGRAMVDYTVSEGDGRKNILVQFRSAEGAVVQAALSDGVFLDTQQPELVISQPAAGGSLAGIALIEASAQDAAGIADLRILIDGVEKARLTTPPYRYYWDTAAQSQGEHTIELRATDRNGYQTQLQRKVNVKQNAAQQTTTVTGKMNLWGAGRSQVIGDGILPFKYSFAATAGQVFRFGAAGVIFPSGDANKPHGPDGADFHGSRNVVPAGGLSGVLAEQGVFLVGVFLDDAEPAGEPPATLDFRANTGFKTLAPALRQVFFIGDGLTGRGTGEAQHFFAPANATRLYLGFSDSCSNNGSGPSCYSDNSGELVVSIDRQFGGVNEQEGPKLEAVKLGGLDLVDGLIISQSGTISLNASDASGVARIELLVDGKWLAAANGVGSYTSKLDISTLANGVHTLTLRAADTLGNSSELSYQITVAHAAPAAPVLTSPQTGTTTRDSVQTVQGRAGAGHLVQLRLNGQAVGDAVRVQNDGVFAIALTLAPGSNEISATATDQYGTSAPSAALQLTLDQSIPAAPGNLSAQGQAQGKVKLAWLRSADAKTVGYDLYRASAPFTTLAEANKLNSKPLTQLAYDDLPSLDGVYYYRVVAVNQVGTPSEPSNTAKALADNTLPKALSIAYAPQGKVDAQSGRVGQGLINITLEVSEPLQAIPYLALVPQGGAPLTVDLNKISETRYTGTIRIDASTPTGVASVLFSARDLVGNRGTEILTGGSLGIETEGPVLTGIFLQPSAPIKNDGSPTILTTFTFSKALKAGAAPKMAYTLSGPLRQPVVVSGLNKVNDTTWNANLVLLSDAGLAGAETLSFSHQSTDDLDNIATRITAVNRFQVYQGNLPPLDVPLGLTAKAVPGGKVKLDWQAVAGAVSYQLYRQGPDQTELLPLVRTTGESYLDQTSADGKYRYAVASVRSSNAQESVSGMSAFVEVSASQTAPGAPQNLVLRLANNGIEAKWLAPLSSNVASYNLYRSNGTILSSVTGLKPIRSGIKNTVTVDTAPTPLESAYVVTAVDAAGNESALSNSAYLNASLLPVREPRVSRDGTQVPVVSWRAPNGSAVSYLVYLDVDGRRLKLTPAPQSATSFTDTGYTTGERRYVIATVDSNGTEVERDLLMQQVSAEVVSGLPVRRGLMNRLQVQVSNLSPAAIAQAQVRIALPATQGGTPRLHASEAFSLAPNETRLVPVVVGGYQDLPANVDAKVAVEMRPAEDELVTLSRTQTLDVSEGALVVGISTEDFTRGGTGKVRLTVENTSDVEVELLTALANGGADSSDMRFKLLDAEGNLLATQAYRQATGAGVITLASGQSVARIAAQSSYISDVFSLNVPASSLNSLRVRLDVDKLRYHTGRADAVEIPGKGSEVRVSLLDTAYYAEITDIAPIQSFGDQDIVIQGRALDRGGNAPLPDSRVKLVLNQQGFERVFSVLTDSEGKFRYVFKPTQTDSGTYRVSAVHPDITDRPGQRAFSINRVTVSPNVLKLDLPRNLRYALPFVAKAGVGTRANNLRFRLDAASQPTGQLPQGVRLDMPAPLTLGERQQLNMPIDFQADSTAQPSGALVVDVYSDEQPLTPLAKVRVEYVLTEAKPYLNSTPAFLQSGVGLGSSELESLTIENKGLETAQNLRFSLSRADGGPAPQWLSISSQPNGSLAVGEKRVVDISLTPPPSTAEGDYEFRLNIQGDNLAPQSIKLFVAVTQSGKGSVLFKASDIYTATIDKQGRLIPGLAGATVSLQNEDVPTIALDLLTDSLGEALFSDLPAGRYKYRVKANSHQEAGGRLQIKPGITANQPVFLEYKLVTVEWTVREVTIQDRYDITLNATFETDVPAAVVVMQPMSINLPKMNTGDVFYGELTLQNHGLIRADNIRQTLPKSDPYFRYEFLVDLPESLQAKQRITIPYRVVALQSIENAGLTGNASGGGCHSYGASLSVDFSFRCQNGAESGGSTGASWFSSSSSSCGTGTGNTSTTTTQIINSVGSPSGNGQEPGSPRGTPMRTGRCQFIPNGGGDGSCS